MRNVIGFNNHGFKTTLSAHFIETPLGEMIAVSDDNCLHLLEFTDKKNLQHEIDVFKTKMQSNIVVACNSVNGLIATELKSYFLGQLAEFKTSISLLGSDFQKRAWQALTEIPYGETCSYKAQAMSLGRDSAYRAVANANARNRLAVIVPCHRVITSGGGVGGYSCGIDRKKWLIAHEARYKA